jgi:hypothetical protein
VVVAVVYDENPLASAGRMQEGRLKGGTRDGAWIFHSLIEKRRIEKQGGMSCQSVLFNRGNAAAPKLTGSVRV